MEVIEFPKENWKYNSKNITVYETINEKNVKILNYSDESSPGYLGLSEWYSKFIEIEPIYVYMDLNVAYKCIVKIDTLLYRFAKENKPIEVEAEFHKLGLRIDEETQRFIKEKLNLE